MITKIVPRNRQKQVFTFTNFSAKTKALLKSAKTPKNIGNVREIFK